MEKFSPDLIDLVKYEKDLLYQKRHNIPLRPVAGISDPINRDWTDSEMQAMRDNRARAQELYKDIKSQ